MSIVVILFLSMHYGGYKGKCGSDSKTLKSINGRKYVMPRNVYSGAISLSEINVNLETR